MWTIYDYYKIVEYVVKLSIHWQLRSDSLEELFRVNFPESIEIVETLEQGHVQTGVHPGSLERKIITFENVKLARTRTYTNELEKSQGGIYS